MINGLQVGPFVDEVCMNPPASMNELTHRATKFMRVEDMRKYKAHAKIDIVPIEKTWAPKGNAWS